MRASPWKDAAPAPQKRTTQVQDGELPEKSTITEETDMSFKP
jgi:hypothetical protein